MNILTRYLIRAHAGPFVFAFIALTGLLFLNAVAQRLEDLAGKGLTWDVILEFLYLSLPHTIALTFPMATLVAVLYAFSELTANNEVTAMKAGGVRPQRILAPLIGVGIILAGVMFLFNDRVLPEANHRLKNLLIDINRKSPTFTLREQVVNDIRTGLTGDVYWLTASRIDNTTSELFEVTIYDITDPLTHRTTSATRGVMAFNQDRTDLYLTLYDGVVYETASDKPGGFQQVYFDRQILPLKNVGNEMQRRAGADSRTDREMSTDLLAEAVTGQKERLEEVRARSRDRSVLAVMEALGRPTAEATHLARPGSRSAEAGHAWREFGNDPVSQRVHQSATIAASQANARKETINRFRVEIHKKYTLAFACIVFVLIGAPLAVRFPRGGLGMVIASSSAIFAIYWVGLITGEDLADKGVAEPAVIMWIPNVLFGLFGLWLFRRMGKEVATNRGGGWEDLFLTFKKLATLPARIFPGDPEPREASTS